MQSFKISCSFICLGEESSDLETDECQFIYLSGEWARVSAQLPQCKGIRIASSRCKSEISEQGFEDEALQLHAGPS